MEEKIKNEIRKIYGEKGVEIGRIKKRLYEDDQYDAAGKIMVAKSYIYDAYMTFPGQQEIAVSILNIPDVEKNVGDALRDWGIAI